MVKILNLHNLVYKSKTKYEQGFIEEEIFQLLKRIGGNFNIDKYNDAMMGNTCMLSKDDEIINYHCDVLTAIRCGIENRNININEFD